MLCQPLGEFAPTARILVLILHACRAFGVLLGDPGAAFALEPVGERFAFTLEPLALVFLRAIAAAANRQRPGACLVAQSEMQRCKAAHRQTDDVCLVEAEMIEYGGNIVGGALDRVVGYVLRHVGWRIAARVERDAAVIASEVAQLGLPAAQIAAKLVHEDQRLAVADFLVMQPDAIVGAREGHGGALPDAISGAATILVKNDRTDRGVSAP